MTKLLIDAGNSRLKWRLLKAPGAPALSVETGFFDHGNEASKTSIIDTLRALWQPLRSEAVDAALYSSVASGELNQQIEALVAELFHGARITRVVSASKLGPIENGYLDPDQLGVDRLLAMCGARSHIHSGALVVATIGTATTIDFVNQENRFKGGVILPGPILMARALHQGTAGLPLIDLQQPIGHGFGLTTEQAIGAGILHASVGAIERLVRSARQISGEVTCVVSGGGGHLAHAALPFESRLLNNLVLDGLALLASGVFSCSFV